MDGLLDIKHDITDGLLEFDGSEMASTMAHSTCMASMKATSIAHWTWMVQTTARLTSMARQMAMLRARLTLLARRMASSSQSLIEIRGRHQNLHQF
jgi:hypothetical protein